MSDRPRRMRLSAEMITAVTAVIIGIGAIAVSLYETTLMRQQLKGSAWPNIEGGFTYNDLGFRYFLTNSGVGPARIRSAEITVDGKPVRDWAEFFERLDLNVNRYATSFVARGALPPGAVHEILVLDPDQPAGEVYAAQGRVGITVCYCSVHDDCWVKTMADDPVPVRACEGNASRKFRN